MVKRRIPNPLMGVRFPHSLPLLRIMKMLGNLFKAVVGTVIETPIAIVSDVITLGGALTDQEKPYTAQAVEKVVDNIQRSTE